MPVVCEKAISGSRPVSGSLVSGPCGRCCRSRRGSGRAWLANRIVFLEEGRITEEGTHDERIKLDRQYARLYSVQAEWYPT